MNLEVTYLETTANHIHLVEQNESPHQYWRLVLCLPKRELSGIHACIPQPLLSYID